MRPIPLGSGVRAVRRFHPGRPPTPELLSMVRAFWGRRGFEFEAGAPNHAVGRRGSLRGNLGSFDMAHLMTRLNVILTVEGEILCEMIVDGTGQLFTVHNRAYWALELATFEAYVRRGDELESEWREFDRRWRFAGLWWLLTLSVSGYLLDAGTRRILDRADARLLDVQPYRRALEG